MKTPKKLIPKPAQAKLNVRTTIKAGAIYRSGRWATAADNAIREQMYNANYNSDQYNPYG
jgi:hypothetical protein